MKGIQKFAIAAGVVVIAVGGFMFFNKTNVNSTVVEIESSSPFSFNPAKAAQDSDFNYANITTATPLTLTKEGTLANYAAKDVNVSKDGKTIKITLKDGLKYQDGSEITANDYKTSIDVLANPKSRATYSSWVIDYIKGGKDFFEGKTKSVSGVKVLNKHTYEIDLNKSYNFFKSILTSAVWGPVKQSVIDRVGVEKYGTDYKDVLSSGEYKIKKFAKSQYIDYVKNEGTSLITQNIPTNFKAKIIDNPDIMASEFKKGNVNSIGKSSSVDKILGYSKSKKADFTYITPASVYLANGALAPENMQALHHALDIQYMIDTFFDGNAVVRNATTPQPYEIEKQIKDSSKSNFNIELAKKLKKPDFKEVTFQVTSESASTSKMQAIIKYMINQWAKIGVKTNLVKKPFGPASGTLGPNTKPRQYDVTLANFGPDYPHPHTFYGSLLGSTVATAYSYWNNADLKKYDELIQKSSDQTDNTKAYEYYIQADALQRANAQLLPLWENKIQRYVKKDGWRTVSMGQVLRPSMWEQIKN